MSTMRQLYDIKRIIRTIVSAFLLYIRDGKLQRNYQLINKILFNYCLLWQQCYNTAYCTKALYNELIRLKSFR